MCRLKNPTILRIEIYFFNFKVDLIYIYIFNKGPFYFYTINISLSYKVSPPICAYKKKLSWPQIDTKRLTSLNNNVSTQYSFMKENYKTKKKERKIAKTFHNYHRSHLCCLFFFEDIFYRLERAYKVQSLR